MKIFLLTFICILSYASAQKFGRCFTPDEYRGSCVYFASCQSLLQLTQKKPIDPRDRLFLALSQCGYRDGQPLVCCKDEEVPVTTPTVPVTQETVTQATSTGHKNLLPSPLTGECGIDFEDRIYGGNVTKIDEFPWLTLLGFSKPNNKQGFHCGGVLINNRYVLTASHCVNGKDLPPTWTLSHVRLGEWDTASDKDCDDSYVTGAVCSTPPVDIAIEEKIPHPNYDPFASSQHNDIALLRLAEEVKYTDFIKPICLPLDQKLRSDDLVKKTNSVAGWGKTENKSASNLKLKVNVNVVSNDQCNTVYNKESRQIVDTQVCAGGKKGEDSCRGDSGGPLMRQNERGNPPYWYLTGLVSYGPSPCGMEGWPGVYTRVTQYIEWITQTIKP